MISHPVWALSLFVAPAVFIITRSPGSTIISTTSVNDGRRKGLDGAKNVNLLVDISMVAGGIKRDLHHTFASVPEDKLFRAIMSVLTDREVDLLEHDIRSGVDSLIDNDFILEDEETLPESPNDSVDKNNDFLEDIRDEGTADMEKTVAIEGSMKLPKNSPDFNEMKKKYIAFDDTVSTNDELSDKSSNDTIIVESVKNNLRKSSQNMKETADRVGSTERRKNASNLSLSKNNRPWSKSNRHSAVEYDSKLIKYEVQDKDVLVTPLKIESHRHLIECGDDEVPVEIDVRMTGNYEGLTWDAYQKRSDLPLMKGYGKDGNDKKEMCFKKDLCYVFRVHDDSVERYKIIMGGFLMREGEAVTPGSVFKFGWESCCGTSCCSDHELQTDIIIEAPDSTETLSWNLVTKNDTQEIIVEGGGYDSMETSTYITHTCLNPRACHKLQVFDDNEIDSGGNSSSYYSIKVELNGEPKVNAWGALPGEDFEFCSICSTKPTLIPNFARNVTTDQRALDITNRLSLFSSTESFVDTTSAQYKAICWIIFDDLRQLEANSTSLVQRYILAVLYYATNGDNWIYKDRVTKPNFMSQDSECKWWWIRSYLSNVYQEKLEEDTGVGCVGEIVTGIDLSKLGLKGTLPSEITKLESLEIFSFFENELEGSIPEEIGNLRRLRDMYIFENKLSGSFPTSFYNLYNLIELNVGQNKMTGTISSLIGHLRNLRSWDSHLNQFSGNIPEEIYGLSDLQSILISLNMFNGTISSRIGQLSRLFELQADGNKLQGTIPSSIGQTVLKTLLLGYNDLTGTIPAELMQSNLETLFIQNNRLEGPIPQEIQDADTLWNLDLSYNSLSGTLPIFPGNLTTIDLKNNNFNGNIPVELSQIQSLRSLQLDNNKIVGVVPNEVCEMRTNFLATFSTDCDGYYVSPEVDCPCCTYCHGDFTDREKFGACPDGELIVQMNYIPFNWYSKYWSVRDGTTQVLNGDQYGLEFTAPEQSAYKSCFASTDCYEFTVDGEDYTYYHYPEEYLSFTISYKDTIIYDNDDENNRKWRGKIQFGYSSTSKGPEVNKCDSVTFENMELVPGTKEHVAYNQIIRMSGTTIDSSMSKAINWIHSDIFDPEAESIYRLRQRYVLALLFYSTGGPNWTNIGNFASNEHECQWEGITCDETHGLIESISIVNNNLIGTIPRELGELIELKSLDLSQNSGLVSTIPDQIANLWSLEVLDLSYSGIVGSIPSAVGKLNSLVYLNLGHNKLNMTIPMEATNLTRLEQLQLNNNWLTGTLPNLSTIKNLKVLDLSNNNFRGDVSKRVISFKSLVTFNLANNLFKGTLPFDITTSVNLQELDMSENQFEGSLQYGLGNLKRLKSVVLSGNQIRGDMPEDLFGIAGLERLRLQDNMLMGTIPTTIGKMKELADLALSYNELKGTIPASINTLRKLRLVHIHGNELTGTETMMTDCVATWGPADERSFISDCGIPTAADSQLECKCCTVCCNADEECQINVSTETLEEPIVVSFISISIVVVVSTVLCLILRTVRHRSRLPDYNFDLAGAFGDDSVYCFMLANDWICWVIAIATSLVQIGLFCLFLMASSLTYAQSDWEYSLRCFPDNESCINSKKLTWIGWTFFCIIVVFFLGRDLIKAFKILYVSAKSRWIRCLFGGLAILSVTLFGIIASFYYNKAIAYTNSQVILNAVVLAIVTDIDEKAFELICEINMPWVERKIQEVEDYVTALETAIDHHQVQNRHGDDSDDMENYENAKEVELDRVGVHEAPMNNIEIFGVDHGDGSDASSTGVWNVLRKWTDMFVQSDI